MQDLGNDDLFGDLAGMDAIVLSNVDELTSSFESIELRNMEPERLNADEQPTTEWTTQYKIWHAVVSADVVFDINFVSYYTTNILLVPIVFS